jgi:hypothetical protein
MKLSNFTRDELRNPRVEITAFRRHDLMLGPDMQLFCAVGAKLNGVQLTPIAVLRGSSGRFTVAVLDEITAEHLHPFDPSLTVGVREHIRRVVLRHARRVERSERAQA